MTDISSKVNELHNHYEHFEEIHVGGTPDLEDFLRERRDQFPREAIEQFREERRLLAEFDVDFPPIFIDEASLLHAPGNVCGGRYEIQQIYERGGLGVIYMARDNELKRTVAVKGIRPEYAHRQDARKRFERESYLTGKLEHPGVVPIYGCGADDRGNPFYTMKFIRGEKLTSAIARLHELPHPSDKWSTEFQKLLRDFVTVCQTLAYAHSQGIVHRDIKPDNIRVGQFGEVLVIDWGLAKQIQISESSDGQIPDESPVDMQSDTAVFQTKAGSNSGTLLYMSPEQADSTLGAVGPTADVYSLGATLFQLLTGKHYLQPADRATMLQALKNSPRPDLFKINPTVPKPLAAICLKALSIRPNERYQSAIELAQEIERWFSDQPVTAFKEPLAARFRRWTKKHPALTSALTATFIVGSMTIGLAAILLGLQGTQLQRAVSELTVRIEELRRVDYDNQILLARESFRSGNVDRTRQFLDQTSESLRGIEWYELHKVLGEDNLIALYEVKDQAIQSGEGLFAFDIPTGLNSSGTSQIEVTADGKHLVALVKATEQIVGTRLPIPGWSVNIHDSNTGEYLRRIAGEHWAVECRVHNQGSRVAVVTKPGLKSPVDGKTAIQRALEQSSLHRSQFSSEIEREKYKDLLLKMQKRPDVEQEGEESGANQVTKSGDAGDAAEDASQETVTETLEIRTYSVEDGQFIAVISQEELARDYELYANNGVATSPDGQRRAEFQSGGIIRILKSDGTQFREIGTLAARDSQVRFMRLLSNNKLVWITGPGTVYIAELPKGPEVTLGPAAMQNAVLRKATADGTKLITLHSARETALVRLWNAHDLSLLAEVKLDGPLSIPETHTFGRPLDAAFSPDGTLLAVTDATTLSVWNVETKTRLYQHRDTTGPVLFSDNGAKLFAIRGVKAVADRIGENPGPAIFDAVSGDILKVVSTSTGSVYGSMDPTGTRMARYTQYSKEIDVFDLPQLGTHMIPLGKDEARGLQGFRFTPNGAMFAIHAAGSIRVLETEHWKTVAELQTDQAKIQDFWFHADGRTLVTITDTGVQIWGFRTGTLLWEFVSPIDDPFEFAVLSPDRRHLIGGNRSLVRW